jgi:hypothetical protein
MPGEDSEVALAMASPYEDRAFFGYRLSASGLEPFLKVGVTFGNMILKQPRLQ